MEQPLHIESPCLSICEINAATGFCKGCWRTRDEVAKWGSADTDERLAILERLKQRQADAGIFRRRKGRRRSKRA